MIPAVAAPPTGDCRSARSSRKPEPGATSLLVRTICESGATGGVSEFPLSSGARAAEFDHVFVASSNLRMHHDVTSNSFGADELTAALPLRQELEHLRARRPDW